VSISPTSTGAESLPQPALDSASTLPQQAKFRWREELGIFGSALVATSLIGVLLGRWLAQRVPPRTLEVAAGILLLVLAVLLVWDVVQG
jgi:Uncharacterized protein family UPF0016